MPELHVITNGLPVSAHDIEAVSALAPAIDRAWNAKDISAFGALFDDKADFQLDSTQYLAGRESIEQHWRTNVFPAIAEGTLHVNTMERLRFVTRDVAVCDGQIRVFIPAKGDRGEQVLTLTAYTSLAIKRDGQWLISGVRLYPLT